MFLAEQVAGNQFTIFPAGVVGTPTLSPAHDTRLSAPASTSTSVQRLVFHAAYYREFNDLFGSVNYWVGAGIRW